MASRDEQSVSTSRSGVTAGRAGILQRAISTAGESIVFLDELEPDAADPEAGGINALRIAIRSGLAEVVGELTLPTGPRIARTNQVLENLLDLMANLHDLFGGEDAPGAFSSLADQVASLYRGWNNVLQLLNMQIQLILKQLEIVREALSEARMALEASGVGPAEGQIIFVKFDVPGFSEATRSHEPMSLDNLLGWVDKFAADGAPKAMTQGGGFILSTQIAPAVDQLNELLRASIDEHNKAGIPAKHLTPRVARALSTLSSRLDEVAWNC